MLERASDAQLTAIGENLADIGYRIADTAGLLSAYLADLDETGPHELAAVEERRAALGTLIRAHGSLDEALALWQTGSARLAELDDDGDRIERLIAERDAARSELDAHADALTAARTEAASRLGAAVTEELHALAMPDARLGSWSPKERRARTVATMSRSSSLLTPVRSRAPSRKVRPVASSRA